MTKIVITDMVCIMCPPLLSYPVPLPDQPGCEIERCPHCKRKMWVSKKKRDLRSNIPADALYIACYDCIERRARTDKEFFKDYVMGKI